MGDTRGDHTAGSTHIRPHPLRSLFLVAMAGWQLTMSFLLSGSDFTSYARPVFLTLAAVLLLEAAWIPTRGVVLHEDHIELRSLRTRHIPWTLVHGIFPEHALGEAKVVLFLSSGKQFRLSAPGATFGIGRSRYLRDYHRIGRAWEAAQRVPA